MEILVAEREQLNRYSRHRISNASLLRIKKRKIPDALHCGSTKAIKENDRRNDGCSSLERTTASEIKHLSGEVELSKGKRLSKRPHVDSKVVENFLYMLSDDELEDEELMFLLKLKGRRRNSDCARTDRSSKDTRIENCQTRNVKLFTSSSSPPSSTISSHNKNTKCSAQNTKVIILLSVHISCMNSIIIMNLYLTSLLNET